MRCLEPVGSLFDDRAHQNFQTELVAVVEHLVDFREVEYALLGIEIHPRAVNANDVEFVLVRYCLQHLMS
jgi:hypothetical protein